LTDNRGPITDSHVASGDVPINEQPLTINHAKSLASAFTLIELLVVIAIITVLAGFIMTAASSMIDRAKRVQAKNDLTQIVTAVTAFQTEYGVYPSTFAPEMTYDGLNGNTNDKLFNALRGMDGTINPRGIVFISPPAVKDNTKPLEGISGNDGQFYDAWGKPYIIRMDTDFNNVVTNPYSQNAGFGVVNTGVIAWSFGKDQSSESVPGPASDKKSGSNADDVISWQ